MLRFGPLTGPVVIAAPALFEEGNRTRAFLVRTLRLLAERGVASALPDLPGQGESLVPTHEVTLADWREAHAAAVGALDRSPVLAFGLRGGTLLDGGSSIAARYHFVPVTGASLLRDMDRARRVAAGWQKPREEPTWLDRQSPTTPTQPELFAGNRLSCTMQEELAEAQPVRAPDRVARLASDPAPADLRLEGRPLWRASEPDVDEMLAQALAEDLAAWVRKCAA